MLHNDVCELSKRPHERKNLVLLRQTGTKGGSASGGSSQTQGMEVVTGLQVPGQKACHHGISGPDGVHSVPFGAMDSVEGSGLVQ